MAWSAAGKGLHFSRHGIVLSSGKFKAANMPADAPCSLEVWLEADLTAGGDTLFAFYAPENLRRFSLHQPSSSQHAARRRGGVDLPTISHYLGHASPNTTDRYAKVDLEVKRKEIARIKPVPSQPHTSWSKDPTILDWLESL